MKDDLIFRELDGGTERFRVQPPRVSRSFFTVLLGLILIAMVAVWVIWYLGREARPPLEESWDLRGQARGQFNGWPAELEFADGKFWLCDIFGGKVICYDKDFEVIREFGAGASEDRGEGDIATSGEENTPVEVRMPRDVAVRADGEVYVLDFRPNMVHVYDEEGRYLRGWGNDSAVEDPFNPEEQEFFQAKGIAVDNDGNAYVADTGRHRIIKFDSEGRFIANWGSKGQDFDQYRHPRGLWIDGEDRLWVCDTVNSRIKIQRLDGSLLEIRQMPVPIDLPLLRHQWNYFFANWRNGESLANSWANLRMVRNKLAPMPYDLAMDGDGNYYVSDQYRRVLKFSPSGKLLMVLRSHNICGEAVRNPYERVGEINRSNYQMFATLAVDDRVNLYHAFAGNSYIRRFGTGR
jgi:sugar lactone lactonase YvrE